MRNPYVKTFLTLVIIATLAFTPDYYLLPGSFYLHKGGKLNVHLLEGDKITSGEESGYNLAQTSVFNLYEGSKKADLSKITKDNTSPVVNYNMLNKGLALVEMNTKELNDIPGEDFITYLTEQGYDDIAEPLKNSNRLKYTEKYTKFLKTLVTVDDPTGNLYEKVLNNELEITLKQNPYKQSYGGDITALVNFKGKPLPNAPMYLYIKTEAGNVYPQKLTTDALGKIYFNLSRDGIYMLRVARIQPSTDKAADYETWCATYTFAFTNSNDEPNTYKEFGFGDKH
ncbi:DUF4198 domain-containing protein [Inquilinus sp. KBS0705]|nr:DUF4198 domain-containing protein [Inquilinus sp. KBS0705]